MTLLFVYGTLLRGEPNHALLAGAGRFVRDARTEPAYTLWDLGPYPALTLGGATAIEGELWDVDAFDDLDAYEGESYARVLVTLEGGERVQAYALLHAAERGSARQLEGAWRKRVASRRT